MFNHESQRTLCQGKQETNTTPGKVSTPQSRKAWPGRVRKSQLPALISQLQSAHSTSLGHPATLQDRLQADSGGPCVDLCTKPSQRAYSRPSHGEPYVFISTSTIKPRKGHEVPVQTPTDLSPHPEGDPVCDGSSDGTPRSIRGLPITPHGVGFFFFFSPFFPLISTVRKGAILIHALLLVTRCFVQSQLFLTI